MTLGRWGNTDEGECIRMVHRALDAGINFIDTADVYGAGDSEAILGKALAGRRDERPRRRRSTTSSARASTAAATRAAGSSQQVKASLRRLKTDWIDLYQLHRPDPSSDISESLGALTDLVREGKSAAIGIVHVPGHEIVEAHWAAERRASSAGRPAGPYSLLVRGIEAEVLPVTQRYGMGAIIWSPLCAGWLPASTARAASCRRRSAPAVPARYDMLAARESGQARGRRAARAARGGAGLTLRSSRSDSPASTPA